MPHVVQAAGAYRGKWSQNQLLSDMDEIVFGRDIDMSGAVHEPEVYRRARRAGPRNQLQQRSDVDEVVFGRDIDRSGPVAAAAQSGWRVPFTRAS